MITLAIDASTYAGDAAVLDGSRVLAEETVAMKGADCERLMPAIASVLVLCAAADRGALPVFVSPAASRRELPPGGVVRCTPCHRWHC
jgi:hypothetical protein